MLTSAGEPSSRPPVVEAIVVGASAGAIEALRILLPAFPATTRIPIVVVVHIPPSAPSALVNVFSPKCALPVRQARDKEPLSRGIWFAPADYHLLVESDRTFSLSVDEAVHFSRPSIDVLFDSAAATYGEVLLGVVLTGASVDGAEGARSIRDAGGFVVVQDPATAEVPIMPAAAIERARPQCVGSLREIVELLRDVALSGQEFPRS